MNNKSVIGLVIYDIANTYRNEVEVLYGRAMENCNA